MRVLSVSESKHVAGARSEELLSVAEAVAIPKAIEALSLYLSSNPISVIGAAYETYGMAGIIAGAATYTGTALAVGGAAYAGTTWVNEVTDHWLSDQFLNVVEGLMEAGSELGLGIYDITHPEPVAAEVAPESVTMMSDICSNWTELWEDVPVGDPYYDNYYDQNWGNYYESYDNYQSDYYGDSYYDSY